MFLAAALNNCAQVIKKSRSVDIVNGFLRSIAFHNLRKCRSITAVLHIVRCHYFVAGIGHAAVRMKYSAGYFYQFANMPHQQYSGHTVAYRFVQHISDKIAGGHGTVLRLRNVRGNKCLSVIARCKYDASTAFFFEHRYFQCQRFFKRLVGHGHYNARSTQYGNATHYAQSFVKCFLCYFHSRRDG